MTAEGAIMAGVQPLVAAALAGLPAAWMADGIQPDTASLGAWMQQQLDSSGGLLMFRRSRDTYAAAERYLRDQGVDVAHELQRAEDARDAATSRTRADADGIRALAISEKRARRRLAFEQAGLRDGCAGFSGAQVRAAAGEVTQAEAALEEACGHDRSLARQARQAVV